MVRAVVQDLSSMGRPVSLTSVAARVLGREWSRARRIFTPRSPYRIGDAVVGDDPFKGRREGVVVFLQGTSAGVDTAQGVFFYDHRQLKKLD
jgi:hypothetical protein